MMTLVRRIVQLSVLVVLALWLADRPGTARIMWHDTVIETSAAFLALIVVILAFGLHVLFRIWHLLRHGPQHWRLRRNLRKMHQGHEQLTQGLIAIASGSASEAGRLAIAARKNLGVNVVSQWLQAQAAQLAGDHKAAREIFRALAASGDAAVLGYRGLITEAKRIGRWDEVDRLVSALHAIRPATPWLSLVRMESHARRYQWHEAESALSHAVTAGLMDSTNGRRTRAALRIAASRQAAHIQEPGNALHAAEQAVKGAHGWLPALLNLAETLSAQGHKRAARRIIDRAWKTHPHPQLAQIIRRDATSNLDAYKQTEQLCRGSETHIESTKALAEAALSADIWGEARRHLMGRVSDGTATHAIFKLLARLERRERGDERAAAAWLTLAAEAPQDARWLCQVCGGAHETWQPNCGHCGAFDTLEWQRAGQRRAPGSSFKEIAIDD